MVDQSAWSARNKQNEFFAKANHVRLAKNQISKRLIDAAGVMLTLLIDTDGNAIQDADSPTLYWATPSNSEDDV